MFFGNRKLRAADPDTRITALQEETVVRRVRRVFLTDDDAGVIDAAAMRLAAIMSLDQEEQLVRACPAARDDRRRLDRLILAEIRSGFETEDHRMRRIGSLSSEGLVGHFGATIASREARYAAIEALAARGQTESLRQLLRVAEGETRAAIAARLHPDNPDKAEGLLQIHALIDDLDAADSAVREAAEHRLIAEQQRSVAELLLYLDAPLRQPAAPAGAVVGAVRVLAGVKRLRSRFPDAVQALRRLGEDLRASQRAEFRPFGAIAPSPLDRRLRDEVGHILEKLLASEFSEPAVAAKRGDRSFGEAAGRDSRRRRSPQPASSPVVVDDSIAPGRDYEALARRMTQRYGPLRRVVLLSHFPDFEIDFEFEAGTLQSRKRRGVYDIHFLSLGYAGEGPECAHTFLRGVGFDLAFEEITKLQAGAVITLENGRATVRYPEDAAAERRHYSALDAAKLLETATDSRLEEFKALVAKDPSLVNFVDDDGASKKPILIHAIDEHHVETALFLIDAGADINCRRVVGDYEYSAFSQAVDKSWDFWIPKFKPLIDRFLELRPDIETDDFIVPAAVRQEHYEVLQHLVEHGKPLEKATLFIDWNSKGAAQMCEHLLSLGAHVNAVDEAGMSALWHAAVRYKNADAVRCLLELGADPDLTPTGSDWDHENCPAIEATRSEEVRAVLRAHRSA